MAFDSSVEQNLFHRLALTAPHPLRLQKISQHIREGPLHEDVGALFGTIVSNQRDGAIDRGLVSHQRGRTPPAGLRYLPVIRFLESLKSTEYITNRLHVAISHLARRFGSLPSS